MKLALVDIFPVLLAALFVCAYRRLRQRCTRVRAAHGAEAAFAFYEEALKL